MLLIGAFDPFDEREAQRVQADAILKKPFVPPDSLLRTVADLLAQSASRSAPAPAAAAPAPTDRPSSFFTKINSVFECCDGIFYATNFSKIKCPDEYNT